MFDCYAKYANIWTFLVIFCLCFFLETITFTYLISAIQSIENQFQIPSKMSGTLVASSDIGYVLFVVVLSYFGSRGNRARWIGGGCLLISIACLIISLPHFIFPEPPVADDKGRLVREAFTENLPPWIHDDNLTIAQLLEYPPIKKLPIPEFVKEMLLDKERPKDPSDFEYDYDYGIFKRAAEALSMDPVPPTISPYEKELIEEADYQEETDDPGRSRREQPKLKMPTPDPAELEAMKELVQLVIYDEKPLSDLIEAVRAKILKPPPEVMYALVTRAAGMPFGRCSAVVNTLKQKVTEMKCNIKQSNNAAYGIVFMGIMLIGIGHSMPWTLGVPLIDDNVKKRSTPLYFAGVFFIRILGPVLGFVIGAACTRVYYNFKPPLGMMPMDPRWIGAWWLGFLIVFVLLLVPSILLFCFPSGDKVLIDDDKAGYGGAASEMKTKGKKRQLHLTDKHRKDEEHLNVKHLIRNFLVALMIVLKNPIYTGCLIGRFFDTMAFKGLFVFLPKYLESHYGMPQFKANLYLAIMGVVGFALGVAVGSIVMRTLRLEGRKAAGYIGLISLIGVCLTFVNLGLGCTSINNKVGKQGMQNGFNFVNECNRDCNCGPVSLYPVCSSSGTAYYSPCTAGCTNMTVIDKMAFKFDFTECSCIDNGTVVSRDNCVDDCGTMLTVYFALSVIGGLIGGTAVIPSILIVLRSIPPQHRSVALGFSGFAISLLSTLPSPIIYGFIVDSACILWDDKCGTGAMSSCRMYDPDQLRYNFRTRSLPASSLTIIISFTVEEVVERGKLRMFGFQGGLRLCGLLFDIWVIYHAKDLKLMDGVEEQEEANAEKGAVKNGAAVMENEAEKIGSISSLHSPIPSYEP